MVELAQLREAVERVRSIRTVTSGEQPSLLCELVVADYELNDGLESFERSDEVSTVGPGAAAVDVESVAV